MKQIIINPIQCINGCLFYPQILPDGTVKKYDRCRICRIYLDRKKVSKGIEQRKKYLIAGAFKQTATLEHPVCKSCKVTFWDQKTLKKHIMRLHVQFKD